MVEALQKKSDFTPREGPVLLLIMDGIGYGEYEYGDAAKAAYTPHLDLLHETCPNVPLKAHGTAVGLPSDKDMGNSEVGHNAIGSGRVFPQGAQLVNEAIESGRIFEGETWKELTQNCLDNDSTLHLIGLFSDGTVHSHIDHVKAILQKAAAEGLKKARVHILLDGRDVGETSALEYVEPFEEFLQSVNSENGVDYRIASGGGRMYITMDRYEADWDMVKRGWETHVHGNARYFSSAKEAITTLREETGAIDQDLPNFVIAENDEPVGTIEDNDSVVFFNFRGDRALEITAAFEEDDFNKFDRGRRPDVIYAGMMEYDGDAHVPKKYLVEPPVLERSVGEYMCKAGVRTLAISETQKFGHVTYFFNGNKTGKVDENLEEYVEITSDRVPFEQRPWMKAAENTDRVIQEIQSGKFDFMRLNLANGDMVGHTGIYEAAIIAVETVDLCLGRLMHAIREAGGIMIVTADHGNVDDMYFRDKKTGDVDKNPDGSPKAKTSHSLNPVPCIIYDPGYQGEYAEQLNEGLGISSLATSSLELVGLQPPEDYDPSILNWKNS